MKKSEIKAKKKARLLAEDSKKSKKKKDRSEDKAERPAKREFSGKSNVVKTIMLNKSNALKIGTMSFENSDTLQIDIRKYYTSGGELLPGKGVMFSSAFLDDVIKALKRLKKKLAEEQDDE